MSSAHCGENTSVNGTIEVEYSGGQTLTHKLNCQGDASSRGTHAEVDGENHWWCGAEANECGSANIEEVVENLFEFVWNEVEKRGDAESNWEAHVVNGEIANVEWKE